jgi:uncharacterized protein YndB with AHSA1/START domain
MSITTLLLILLAAAPLQSDVQNSPETSGLTAERIIDAPTSVVWEAFTSREVMETWQVGRTNLGALEIGATFRTSYNADSNLDDDTVIETEILAFDPGRMLATRIVRAPGDFPFPDAIHQVWSVLYVEPVGDNQTRVTVRMFGFSDSEESAGMREFFDWGNPYELEQLAAFLAGR